MGPDSSHDHAHDAPDWKLERVAFFSDAVFAIAITLLGIEIGVPAMHENSDHAAIVGLVEKIPHLLGFVVSFLVIGAIWAAHHRLFGLVRHFSPALVWPNLHLLMFVGLVPFATAYMTEYSYARIPHMTYMAVLCATGLLQVRLYRQVLKRHLLDDSVDTDRIRALSRRVIALPAAAGIGAILAWWIAGYAEALMMTIPLLVRLLERSATKSR
jgi:uncharacterized membrane protein